MIDCFDGLVVSWTIGTRPDSDLVNTMLDAAIETVATSKNRPVIHSDRGAHYRWPGCLSRVHNARLTRSMSRKGCSPDNAACEGFFGRLKTELFYPRRWQDSTIEQFIQVVDSLPIRLAHQRLTVLLMPLRDLKRNAAEFSRTTHDQRPPRNAPRLACVPASKVACTHLAVPTG